MAKHKSWHGADRKRALRAKLKIEKRREAKRRERIAAALAANNFLKNRFYQKGGFYFRFFCLLFS